LSSLIWTPPPHSGAVFVHIMYAAYYQVCIKHREEAHLV